MSDAQTTKQETLEDMRDKAIEIIKSFPEATIDEFPLSSRTGKYWPRLASWLNTQRTPFLESLKDKP